MCNLVNVKNADFSLYRINNDVYGNPRYVIHFLELANSYDEALKISRKHGGKKYHNKSFGGGIAFQSYNVEHLVNFILENRIN